MWKAYVRNVTIFYVRNIGKFYRQAAGGLQLGLHPAAALHGGELPRLGTFVGQDEAVCVGGMLQFGC